MIMSLWGSAHLKIILMHLYCINQVTVRKNSEGNEGKGAAVDSESDN